MVKTTTLRLPKEILIKIKALAVENGKSQNSIINELINKGLKSYENNEGKIKARVINHEMPGYDPNKKLKLNDSLGIIEVENPEKIDVQELKDSIHYKKELY
jgi:predicted HicB family RNase H-like nuclease